MKILVTGATGFIGQHLTKALIKNGHSVFALARSGSQRDNLAPEIELIEIPDNQGDLEKIFEREKFDGVIHLASLYLMSHKPEEIENLIDSNIKLGTKVIDAATKAKVGFFINTGSFVQHYNSEPYNPTNLYAATKQAFQDVLKFYVETTTTTFVTLELFNTFGPGDTRPKIFTLWDNAIKEAKTIDMSPGEQTIDINYIDNIVDGYLEAIKLVTTEPVGQISGKSYSLMSKERMTLKELAKVFSEEMGDNLKINFGTLPYRERETMIPMDRGELLPGWEPKVSLREGIRRTFKQ